MDAVTVIIIIMLLAIAAVLAFYVVSVFNCRAGA